MNKKKKKFEFSKVIVVLVNAIFMCVLYYCLKQDYSSILDASVFLSAITSSGAIALTTDVWYMKKSQAEHVSGISSYTYGDIMDIRLHYNEEMMKLKKKYNMTDYDVSKIETESPMDDISEDALNRTEQKLNEQMDEATSSIEAQTL